MQYFVIMFSINVLPISSDSTDVWVPLLDNSLLYLLYTKCIYVLYMTWALLLGPCLI